MDLIEKRLIMLATAYSPTNLLTIQTRELFRWFVFVSQETIRFCFQVP